MRFTGILIYVVLSTLLLDANLLAQNDEVTDEVLFGPAAPVAPEVIARDADGYATLRAIRLERPLTLDGKLNEEIYSTVSSSSDFIQQEPQEGESATEQTEVWILFDDNNIYISARCWDSQPDRLVANEMRRDNLNIYRNDNLTVVLDTFYDRRNGYFFQTNSLGALRDQEVTDEGAGINTDWNTVWNVKASRDEEGWTLEMAIPFKSLRYRPTREQVWGINIRRMVLWKNETSFLNPVANSYQWRGIYQLSRAATIVGIQAPQQSRNLELKPYAITTTVTDNSADPPYSNDLSADAGIDVKYGLTRGLTADFTFNTDFAQVEEDQVQVNLTRFSVFFPEKREFFLEGQGIFAYGGVETRGAFNARPDDDNPNLAPIMFFSRRIGLSEDGIVPIIAGGRVTGRAGKYRIGALNIQTNEAFSGTVPSTNHSVFRLRRDILRRSDIGVIATHRTHAVENPASSNSLFGFDANFTFYENLRINSYYARSWTPEVYDKDAKGQDSYRAKADYAGDRYGLVLEHLLVGERFEPELGFLRRRAFRRNFAQARFSPRPQSIGAVRRFSWEADFDHIAGSTTGILETRRLRGAFRVELESGDETAIEYSNNYEFLTEDFEIADGIVLPLGPYRFQGIRALYQFGPQRPLPGFVSFRRGSFFSGDRTEFGVNARVEVTSQFSIEPRVFINWVNLEQGDFTDKLLSARINYTFSPRMQLSSLLQYSSSSDFLSTSVRFRWEYQPGSDLFVVYSDGRETFYPSFPRLANRTFAVKFTRLFRF